MTWDMRITPQALAGLGPQVALRVTVTSIRDGTPGLSLSVEGKVVGEWTDSRASSLSLSPMHEVTVLDQDAVPRYRLLPPGTPLSARQLSNTEVEVSLSLEAAPPFG